MAHPVYVYFDANGKLSELVKSDDDAYSPSERPGEVRVCIPRDVYDALPRHLTLPGMAMPFELSKACLSALLESDPERGLKLHATISALA